MSTQQQKAQRFRALHEAPGAFLLPNVWDGGSAALVTGLGYAALATSSAAAAATLGKLDGAITREEALAHARLIAEVSDLPVAADLENGFGHSPETAAETIRLAAQAGLVGASIEDASGDAAQPIYEFEHAVARVAAAVQAARRASVPFVLTARTENYFWGREDLGDTVRRLQAFERAGADVLFAPGLPDLEAVRTVCAAVRRPVNFMVGIPGKSFSQAELARAGVKRISLSTTLYRAAMGSVVAAAREAASGNFSYVDTLMKGDDLDLALQRQAAARRG
ncbi:MAG: isocitrate lyase/phosphoenolpyruvate mutase family protein [Gammaproteobacteria bacterium]|nr:isocitrate lyase/phosphoenolpyruvate mutase family protein [Gammaproteobacteria bacterium]